MHSQSGLHKDAVLTKCVFGAHPIIAHFMELMRLRGIINTYMVRDHRQKLDDGSILTLLIHNILTTPHPLYEMPDGLTPLDTRPLGLEPDATDYIQDDRICKGLFKFYGARHQDVFFRLALRVIKIFRLDCSRIHHDTTTVTFAGKYGGWCVPEVLTYGKNKDHRPDLKQLVLGLSVTGDGAVPIAHQVYSGNQTDDRLHPANHKALQKLLQRVDFIYVADSQLATAENLRTIAACQGLFVSVMPRIWKADTIFRRTCSGARSPGSTSCRGTTIGNRIPSSTATTWQRVTIARRTDTSSTGFAVRRKPNKMPRRVAGDCSAPWKR